MRSSRRLGVRVALPLALVGLVLLIHNVGLSPAASIGAWFRLRQSSLPEGVAAILARGSITTLPKDYDYDFPDRELPTAFNDPNLELLKSRLYEFLARPILSHDEAAGMNEDNCPLSLSDRLVDPPQLTDNDELWRYEIDKEIIAEKRGDLVLWLKKQLEQGRSIVGSQLPEEQLGTRGIVIAGGNDGGPHRILTQIKILRHHGCTLPIEVVHFKGELGNRKLRSDLEDLGVRLVKIEGLEKDLTAEKNFEIKGLAITLSSFQEVLYLDSDNYLLRDPTHLFDSPTYKESGRAVFWPDITRDHAHNAIWRLMGVPCSFDDFTFESGQILIDKMGNNGLNLAALWVASGMLDDSDFWFTVCHGDKDAFRWAFVALGIPFGVAPRWLAAVGFLNNLDNIQKDRFLGHSMVQYDLITSPGFKRPPPLFVHGNLLKTIRGEGYNAHNLFTHIKYMSMDDYHEPTLNQVHFMVYTPPWRLFGTDIEIHRHGREHLTPDERTKQRVLLSRLEDLDGEPFRGFARLFFEMGGVAGGY